jgi:hypothetical protein
VDRLEAEQRLQLPPTRALVPAVERDAVDRSDRGSFASIAKTKGFLIPMSSRATAP